ncbi:L,D-transpeptidase family protein [Adlercreutzia sp. R25]|uniref:L,D-transpeptidase family protein n=1 Tax=Adlercreutzia shanghongiae TaxID=3111773 RepID=UPI002DBF07E8|nr:L,D-transpeptidase family protein [Adlercreutzia sp. R25]MEC4273297.1 L,D-transpeptidase family protein [Adlercreutzia sp. R25]
MKSLERNAVRSVHFARLMLAFVLMLLFVPSIAFADDTIVPEESVGEDAMAASRQSVSEGADEAPHEPDSDGRGDVARGLDDIDALGLPVSAKEDEENASLSTGADEDRTEDPSEAIRPDEPVEPGLKTAGGQIQFVGEDGALVKSDWRTVDGKRYYFDSKGNAVRWSQKIEDRWYYFNGECAMQKGWITWMADGTKSYFGSDGAAVVGWQNLGGKRYYFSPATGRSYRWSCVIDGESYYFNGDSSMHTGLLTWRADGLKSYYGADGKRLTGWQKAGGKTYYIDPATGKSVRWEKKIGAKWYYFNGQSQMQTGWLKWSGKQLWSYYGSDGVRASGTRAIGGFKYAFDANGRTKTKPVTVPRDQYNMNQKAQNYTSGTKYLIMVNRSTHKVGVYQKRSGYWECIKYFSCVTGKSSTPTITGSFKTTGGKRTSLSTDSRAKYCTQITGGYFFHTILASESELGKSLSHGCVRLSYSSAKWIYQNIKAGTKVVIY